MPGLAELIKVLSLDPGVKICHHAVVRWFEMADLIAPGTCANTTFNYGSAPTFAREVLLSQAGDDSCGRSGLLDAALGSVVVFVDGQGKPQHSMVVCGEGQLAGVNNLNVVSQKACDEKPDRVALHCVLDVERDLAWVDSRGLVIQSIFDPARKYTARVAGFQAVWNRLKLEQPKVPIL